MAHIIKRVITLQISDKNFYNLTKLNLSEIHKKSIESKGLIPIKSSKNFLFCYNANWQNLEPKLNLSDFLNYYFVEQFNLEFKNNEKKLSNVHFLIPAKNNLVNFLDWFTKLMHRKRIPLERNGFRAHIYIKNEIDKKGLNNFCIRVKGNMFAITFKKGAFR